jgi:Ankyrin repeats (3 copies)
MNIFGNNDIDSILLQYLDLIDDYAHIRQINKYYYNLMSNNSLFIMCEKLYSFNKFNRISMVSKQNSLFINACQTNNLLLCKYLIEKFPIDIHSWRDFAFQVSCINGRLNIAKWLVNISMGADFINIHADCEYAFKFSCENGHIDVVQWLVNISKSPININVENEYAFRSSCQYGHLNVAKWLIDLSKLDDFSFINIHAYHDYAFSRSCENGHLNTAKWLLTLGEANFSLINIHTDNDYAFKYSKKNNHLCVYQWLIDLSTQTDYSLSIVR